MKFLFVAPACLLVLGSVPLAGANKLTRQEKEDGFVLLFDGKSTQHWRTIRQRPGAGGWVVRKGILTWEKGGSWLGTEEKYYDFVLRLEYRTGQDSNSGIFLRSADEGNPAFSGMELQIASDAGKPPGKQTTGALYGAVAPARNMARPPGEWNTVEVIVYDRRVHATWNGAVVLDVNLDDARYQDVQERPLAERVPFGRVGLQAYSSGEPVEFRNLRVRVLKTGPIFPPRKSDDLED
ncbi:MAG: DUF1080 domain-containing protein [Bryobacterales bacterium]|nr:DUF1080 domain-containing protein [Bryobacterales bacterium]